MLKKSASFFGSFLLFLLLPTFSFATQPWDTAFHADTAATLAAAKAIDAGDSGMVLLLDDYQLKYDDANRCTMVQRRVFRVVDKESADEWATISRQYSPWRQSKPEIRARVITASGQVHWLDPKTIADAPAIQLDATLFSDDRELHAPLPAIDAGAVVEVETTIRDTASLLDAGIASVISIDDFVLVQRFHLVLSAPPSLPLKTASALLPESAIRRTTPGGLTQFEVELGPLPVRKQFEFGLPSDVAARPYFAYSTGKSWQDIATRYDAIVNQQLQSADLNALLTGVDIKGKPLDVAARLSAALHKQIRYTGVEFGDAAIVPRTPAEILKRKYGDCKDKSALLVAMLRSAGLNAWVALLSSGEGQDVDAKLPGLGRFNHAIVYVGGDAPFWIDATASKTRIGDLPTGDQGRLALIARRESTELVRTPESSSADNRMTATIAVRIPDSGPSDIIETVTATGWIEGMLRQLYEGSDAKKLHTAMENHAKTEMAAKAVGEFHAPDSEDFSHPYQIQVESKRSKLALAGPDDAGVALNLGQLLRFIPFWLRSGGDEVDEKPRTQDFVFTEPYRAEFMYRIFAPPLYKVNNQPPDEEIKLGSALYSRKFRTAEDGALEVVLRFDSGKRRLTASEFAEMRKGLKDHLSSPVEGLILTPSSNDEIASGNIRKAVAAVREYADAHPQSSSSHIRMSRTLVAAGDGAGALSEARKAVELGGGPSALAALSWASEHDSFGRQLVGDWNFAEADKRIREAVEQAPDDVAIQGSFADLLEYDAHGQRWGDRARLEEAVKHYREVIKIAPIEQASQNLLVDLLRTGQFSGVRDELKKRQATSSGVILGAVSTALSDGAPRAIQDIRRSYTEDQFRVQGLYTVALHLVQMRRYDLAGEFFRAATQGARDSASMSQITKFSRMKRWEDALLPETDPIRPVQNLIVELAARRPDAEKIHALFTKDHDWSTRYEPLERIRTTVQVLGSLFATLGVTQPPAADLALGDYAFKSEGDDESGFKVSSGEITLPFASDATFYVVKEDGKYRILSLGSSQAEVGKFVLKLLANNELRNAQDWLDRAIDGLPNDAGEGRPDPAAKLLWKGSNRSAEMVKQVAAALISKYSSSETAIQILVDARAKTTGFGKATIDLALCDAYETAGKWSDLLAAGRRLSASPTFDIFGYRYGIIALTHLERWADLQLEAAKWIKVKGAPKMPYRASIVAYVKTGKKDEALKQIEKMQKSGGNLPDDRAFEARTFASLGKIDDDLIKELADDKFGTGESSFWYSLGMLQVLQDKPDDARKSLLEGLARDDFSSLDAAPWALSARILELYGAPGADAAREKARTSAAASEVTQWVVEMSKGKKNQ